MRVLPRLHATQLCATPQHFRDAIALYVGRSVVLALCVRLEVVSCAPALFRINVAGHPFADIDTYTLGQVRSSTAKSMLDPAPPVCEKKRRSQANRCRLQQHRTIHLEISVSYPHPSRSQKRNGNSLPLRSAQECFHTHLAIGARSLDGRLRMAIFGNPRLVIPDWALHITGSSHGPQLH